MQPKMILAAIAAAVLFVSTAHAAIEYTRTTLPAGSYYINAYGGLGDGFSPGAGDAMSPDYLNTNPPVSYNFDYHNDSALLGSAFSSVNYSNSAQNVTGSAHGTVGFGVIKLYSDYAAPNSAFFPAYRATGGWKESYPMTPPSPALNGVSGSFSVTVHVDGDLQSLAGFNGWCGFQLTAYKDSNTVLSSTTYSGQGQQGFPYNQSVNGDITFNVPYTFGTPLTLGVYGLTWARTASTAGVDLINTGFSNFDHTVTWQGISNFTADGNPIAYDLTSNDGMNWTSAVPEPGSMGLLLMTIIPLARRRRA